MARRTLENCDTILRAKKRGMGTPKQEYGKCYGYPHWENKNEVMPICSWCKLYKSDTLHS